MRTRHIVSAIVKADRSALVLLIRHLFLVLLGLLLILILLLLLLLHDCFDKSCCDVVYILIGLAVYTLTIFTHTRICVRKIYVQKLAYELS